MNNESIRAAIRFAGLVLPLMWTSGSVAAQMQATARASSYGVSVSTATVNQKKQATVLTAGEMMATDQASDVTDDGLVSVQDAVPIIKANITDGSERLNRPMHGTS